MNNKWKRKRYFGNWGIGNNNKSQFLKMSQYSRDNWSIKPWHSASNFQGQRNDFQFRPQINQNRRNSCRWETFQEDMNYSFPKESLERNDFQPNSESDLNPFDNEKPRKNSRIFLKWCNDILQEHPNHIRLRMKKNFWDKLDPKDNITISCKEAATKKSASLTPYDGVTPTGLQGMSKAWLCEFCSVVLLDIEHRNSHLMGKNHYLKYAKFCKKYAEKKLLKYKIIKKEIKKKNKKSSKNDAEDNDESKDDKEKFDKHKIGKSRKDHSGNQGQEKRSKLSPKNDQFSEISIEEELNYDFLE